MVEIRMSAVGQADHCGDTEPAAPPVPRIGGIQRAETCRSAEPVMCWGAVCKKLNGLALKFVAREFQPWPCTAEQSGRSTGGERLLADIGRLAARRELSGANWSSGFFRRTGALWLAGSRATLGCRRMTVTSEEPRQLEESVGDANKEQGTVRRPNRPASHFSRQTAPGAAKKTSVEPCQSKQTGSAESGVPAGIPLLVFHSVYAVNSFQ